MAKPDVVRSALQRVSARLVDLEALDIEPVTVDGEAQANQLYTAEKLIALIHQLKPVDRQIILEIRRALFLFIPGILATWWGRGTGVTRWPFLAVGLALAIVWFAFGRTAEKAQRQIEELRNIER